MDDLRRQLEKGGILLDGNHGVGGQRRHFFRLCCPTVVVAPPEETHLLMMRAPSEEHKGEDFNRAGTTSGELEETWMSIRERERDNAASVVINVYCFPLRSRCPTRLSRSKDGAV